MNAEAGIRELVRVNLLGDHHIDCVRFIDELLLVVADVGEIKCSLADDRRLRFETPQAPAWEVEIERARGKLRMLCARLGVLCQESETLEGTLYGGEGVIKKAAGLNGSSMAVQGQVGLLAVHAPAVNQAATDRSSTAPAQWAVRFMNTPDRQTFCIQAQ